MGSSAQHVPLCDRLPNPPASFTGREADVAWLEEAFGRAPVSVVVGLGGMGKTVLCLQVLYASGAAERAVYVGVRPGEHGLQLRQSLHDALVRADGEAAHTLDPEELTAATIDRAEESARVVMIDDFHHTDAEEGAELLVQLASYARRSRWVVTSRRDIRARELAGQVRRLDPFARPDLSRLAAAWGHDPSSLGVQQAIERCAGTPLLLLQLLDSKDGVREARDAARSGLSRVAQEFLEALSVLHHPMPLEEVGTFVRVPDREEFAMLVRRGTLDDGPRGVRLHDLIRVPFEDAALPMWGPRAAAALEIVDEPRAALEAARLWAAVGSQDRLTALLARQGDWLLAVGYAPQLFALLQRLPARALRHWRLRCAALMGNPTALGAVRAPPEPSARDRIVWATALWARGQPDRAMSEARRALATAEGPDRATARTLLARAALSLGQRDVAANALEGETGLLAQALRHRARAGALPTFEQAPLEVRVEIAEAALEAGDHDEAARWFGPDEDVGLSYLSARRAALLRARVAVRNGDLAQARALAKALRRYTRGASLIRPATHEVEAEIGLLSGDWRSVEDLLASARREAPSVDFGCAERIAELAAEHDLALGRRSTATGSAGDFVRARWGERGVPRGKGAWAARTNAQRALLADDLIQARLEARRADELARQAHHVRWQLGTTWELAEVAAIGGDPEGLRLAHASLKRQADRLGSQRYQEHVTWLDHIDDPAALERLLGSSSAPAVVQRARAMLGVSADLDLVDQRVVEALRTFSVRTLGSESESAWGVDARHRIVWRPDGTTASLGRGKQPLAILSVLFTLGGVASKEALVVRLWGVSEYHPLKHDGRLQVAIHKLRTAIESQPSDPRLLLTEEGGYRLALPLRWVEHV